MLLALKKVQIIKITPPQVLTPSKKIPQAKFLIAPPPLFTAIWKTLHTVSFSLKFDPDVILIGCGLLPLSRMECLQVAILILIFCNVRHFILTKTGHRISSGTEERACGNSKHQLKRSEISIALGFLP